MGTHRSRPGKAPWSRRRSWPTGSSPSTRPSGRLRTEAGFTLAQLNRTFLPRGWFVPVSPGTQYVTVGGMVASDVHGKNHHHAGSFGQHVRSLRLRVADGSVVECSPEREPELFRATIGGMGLTGHILEAEFDLERAETPWIWQDVRRFADIETGMALLREAGSHWPYTMAWLDVPAGRGVLFAGRWARPDEAPDEPPRPRPAITVPVDLPGFALNRLTGAVQRSIYYWGHRPGEGVTHPQGFFYPLDQILDWNRLYGRRGFSQYQCMLPHTGDGLALPRLLERTRELRLPIYLCVLKDMGPAGTGGLSFGGPGFTLAMDTPADAELPRKVDALNELVLREGGTVYLSKDAYTRAEHYAAMAPGLGAWRETREKWDPEGRLRSALSVRLLGDEA